MNVTGKLIGNNSAPVAGVRVHVLDGKSIISTSPPSAADGTFSCTVVEQWYDKPLALQIDATGYIPFKRDLQVQDGAGPYDYEVQLTPSVPVQTPTPTPTPPDSPNPESRFKLLLRAIWAFLSMAFQGFIVLGCIIYWLIFLKGGAERTLPFLAAIFVLTVLSAVLVYRKVRRKKN